MHVYFFRLTEYSQAVRQNKSQLLSSLDRMESSHSDLTNSINTVISGQSKLANIEAHLLEVRHVTSQLSQNMQSLCGTFNSSFMEAGTTSLESMLNKAAQRALSSPEIHHVLISLQSDTQASYSNASHATYNGYQFKPSCNPDDPDGTIADSYNSCLSLRQQRDSGTPALQTDQNYRFRRKTLSRHDATYKSIFGTVEYYTRVVRVFSVENRYSKGADQHQIETSFTVVPAPWLFSYGLRVCMIKATQNIKHNVQYFPLVPEDATIFDFCKKGNIDAVRTLFDKRMASPFDTSMSGWMPLHVRN